MRLMTDADRGADLDMDDIDGETLWRMLVWAGFALLAVGGAVLAAQSDRGSLRLASLFEPATEAVVAPAPVAKPHSAPQQEAGLAAAKPPVNQRGPLQPRRDTRDITGSISDHSSPARDALPAGREPLANPAAAGSVATKTEFGIDIGGETSINALRTRWQSLRSQHATLVAGLRPLVALRDSDKDKVELRLILGPFTDAAGAARLCAALDATGIVCQPTIFDGQRLALQ
jgi:hypothetical protein